MDYYGLKSLVGSNKERIPLKLSSKSFYVFGEKTRSFVEPAFAKLEFPQEKPAILLVSAVGASGKTTTARSLSYDIKLPILDLAAHKAVGDNTLTGIITTAYPIEIIGRVLEGLQKGTHGIIIDGIDEGRSKTTEQGFEAFLDDLVARSSGAKATVIIIFGRGQVLLSTWCYLVDKGADVGLVQIMPFTLDQAKAYIDNQVPNRNGSQQRNYEEARDAVLNQLVAVFPTSSSANQDAFLSFIGYPPVLDAIGTLLRQEPNYYRVKQALGDSNNGAIEIALLIHICDYLIDREHDKALDNFIRDITADMSENTGQQLRDSLYTNEEQCARVLSRALGRQLAHQFINDGALNERYEAAIESWCPDHPFLDDTTLRNPVFAAATVARCALSCIEEYQELAWTYANSHLLTYHLLYLMEVLGKEQVLDIRGFSMLLKSAADFLSPGAEITVDVDGESWDESEIALGSSATLEITVELPGKQQERTFVFRGCDYHESEIVLGPYLLNATITLPGNVKIIGSPLEAVGANSISARVVHIDATDLNVRSNTIRKQSGDSSKAQLFVDAKLIGGHADAVAVGDGTLHLQGCDLVLDYPLARYAHKVITPPLDADLWEKYIRLRRILIQFRSHKKGGLAKLRDKVEHERVVGNDLGRLVLDSLLREQILTRDDKFYYVDSERLADELSVTWHDLRQHKWSNELESFLRRVK